MSAAGNHDVAVVVAHEILGPTRHIDRLKAALGRHGFDVYAPNLMPSSERAFTPVQQEIAYAHFVNAGGVTAMATRLTTFTKTLRSRYRKVGALGSSVGATCAWIAASRGVFDAVVGLYGSRIRDHPDLVPTCPCLLLFAEREPSFSPRQLVERLAHTDNVTTRLYECAHGFVDIDNPNHDTEAAARAMETAAGFLETILLGDPGRK